MAKRVTAEGVRQVMVNCTLGDPVVDSYITAANLIVDAVLSDSGLGSATLTEIERFYAAHMISSTSFRLPSRQKVGDVEIEYGAQLEYVGKGYDRLASTPYGQIVMQLDTTGKLVASAGKKAASIFAITSFEE